MSKTVPASVILGTRVSPLALLQTYVVRDRLIAANPGLTVEIAVITVVGDQIQDRALAEVGGAAAPAFVDALRAIDAPVTVLGPRDDRWRVSAADDATLADALAAVPRPPGRLRLAVDPPRL